MGVNDMPFIIIGCHLPIVGECCEKPLLDNGEGCGANTVLRESYLLQFGLEPFAVGLLINEGNHLLEGDVASGRGFAVRGGEFHGVVGKFTAELLEGRIFSTAEHVGFLVEGVGDDDSAIDMVKLIAGISHCVHPLPYAQIAAADSEFATAAMGVAVSTLSGRA